MLTVLKALKILDFIPVFIKPYLYLFTGVLGGNTATLEQNKGTRCAPRDASGAEI